MCERTTSQHGAPGLEILQNGPLCHKTKMSIAWPVQKKEETMRQGRTGQEEEKEQEEKEVTRYL